IGALRDFAPAYDGFGSSTTEAVKAYTAALVRFASESRQRDLSRHVCLVPKADICSAAKDACSMTSSAATCRVRARHAERLGGLEVDHQRCASWFRLQRCPL